MKYQAVVERISANDERGLYELRFYSVDDLSMVEIQIDAEVARNLVKDLELEMIQAFLSAEHDKVVH